MKNEIPLLPARRKRKLMGVVATLLLALIALANPMTKADAAVTLTTLHAFNGNSNGGTPYSNLVEGVDGNFYGTTTQGGTNNAGIAFKITPDGTFTLLHSFTASDGGSSPHGDLPLASDGNFYSTAGGGGVNGYGTVFKMTPDGTVTTLYSFTDTGGRIPLFAVVEGTDGNFYGNTPGGSSGYQYGVLFKMTPAGVLTNLHVFNSTDGNEPDGDLIQASDGNFYGETFAGGPANDGTIFKIATDGTFTTLHSFNGTDGKYPRAGLTVGTDGNFYGVTDNGGTMNLGTVFKMTPAGVLTTLYSFSGPDGRNPEGRLIQATDGNFYGTTSTGGSNNIGTIFKITPAGTLTTVYSLAASTDGQTPKGGLVQGSDGNLYGMTQTGGSGGYGTVYKLSGVINLPPVAPVSLAISSVGDAQVALTWPASNSATSYNVYQGTATNGELATPVQTGITGTSVTLTGLSNGTTYYFKVAAVNDIGTSGFSPEVSAAPLALPTQVTGVTATPGNAQVALTWSTSIGASTYTIYASTTSGGETALATGIASTSYNATGLTNGTTYYFTVAGTNASGTGAQSNEISATPTAGTTATPTFTPAAGTYTSAQTVTISDSTSGATIHYTIDGTTPTSASPTYSAPISIASTTTLKAIATATGYSDSGVASAVFTVQIPSPPPSDGGNGNGNGNGGGGAFGLPILLALLMAAGLRRTCERRSSSL